MRPIRLNSFMPNDDIRIGLVMWPPDPDRAKPTLVCSNFCKEIVLNGSKEMLLGICDDPKALRRLAKNILELTDGPQGGVSHIRRSIPQRKNAKKNPK